MSYKEKLLGREKTKEKALAVLVISVFAIALIFGASSVISKTVTDDFPLSSAAQCSVSVDYYGYYNGEKVSAPITQAPWLVGGQALDALGFDVTWTVEGQFLDWTTLDIVGTVKIYRINYMGTEKLDITPNLGTPAIYSHGLTATTGDVAFTIDLMSLLSGISRTAYTADGVEYWDVVIEVVLTGQVTDIYDVDFTDSTGVLFASFRIEDATSGFTLNGGVG